MSTFPLVLGTGDPIEHLAPHPITTFGPVVFTSHMLMLLLAAGLMAAIFIVAGRNYPLVPTGARNLLDTLLEFVRSTIARPILGEQTDRYVPFLWTLFFFILINNVLGFVPLDAFLAVSVGHQNVFGAATTSLSVTGGLAIVVFVVIHAAGIIEQARLQMQRGRSTLWAAPLGVVLYLYRIVPHVPGVVGVLLFPLLLVLELVGTVIRAFALAMRLFANMMAGHVVLATVLMMIPTARGLASVGVAIPTVIGCIALSLLELFVAFLQAYIFVFLTCLFIGAVVKGEH
jgi:F-type H+-transporting ATPase subunit a